MDQLIARFRSTPDDDVKFETVRELEDHLADPRAVAFLTEVVADPGEYDLARIEGMKILALWPPAPPALRAAAGRAIAAALREDDELIRQYAAMSLGPYVDDPGVFAALSTALLHDDDSDVRHNALSSFEEAGPSGRTVELLRRLDTGSLLGRSAARTVAEWARAATEDSRADQGW